MAFLIPLLSSIFFSLFGASVAYAQYDSSSSFSFSLQPADTGCVKVSYFYTNNGFPNLSTGDADSVRFYYGGDDPYQVTEESPFQEATFMKDENDSWALSPNEFCGFKEGHYSFKYGLVDTQGKVIEFQQDFDQYSNAVDIGAPPVP